MTLAMIKMIPVPASRIAQQLHPMTQMKVEAHKCLCLVLGRGHQLMWIKHPTFNSPLC